MMENLNEFERIQKENNLLKEIVKTQKHTIDLLIKHFITENTKEENA